MKKVEKPKLISSGSDDLKEVASTKDLQESSMQKESDTASDLFKQILDATMIDSLIKESFADSAYIVQSDDNNPVWLLSLTTKTFRRIPNKSEITMLDKIDDKISHCLILNDLYEVKNEMIKEIGFN